MNLQIETEARETEAIVHLSGEIDAYTASQLREKLIPLTEKENQHIIIDLKNVNYMDSTGLGVFIGALKSCKKNQSTMVLTGATDRVKRLFTITGLDEVMKIEEGSCEK